MALERVLNATFLARLREMAIAPCPLVAFYFGSGTVRYAAHIADVIWDSQTWNARGMRMEPIEQDLDLMIPKTTLHIDNVDEAVSGYITANEDTIVGTRVVIYVVDLELLGSADYKLIIFDGTVHDFEVSLAKCTFYLRSYLDIDRIVPYFHYQQNCIWEFGSNYCGYNIGAGSNGAADAGSTASTIVDVSLLTQADNYWRCGVIEFTSGSLDGEIREILSSDQAAKSVTVEYPFSAAPNVGDTFNVKIGCGKTVADCVDRSNDANFVGFHCMPSLIEPGNV